MFFLGKVHFGRASVSMLNPVYVSYIEGLRKQGFEYRNGGPICSYPREEYTEVLELDGP